MLQDGEGIGGNPSLGLLSYPGLRRVTAVVNAISHFSKLLSKLFLSAPEIIGKETNPCNWQSYYTVLRCSKLYMDKFQDISPEQVCVIINENEEIINITSVDETVSLYDINYPCTVCLCQVTWDQNDTGNGLRCDTCHNWYHNSCAPPEFQFSLELLKCLDGGPPANAKLMCILPQMYGQKEACDDGESGE